MIALWSDPTLDAKWKPDLIYSVLLQYFSDTPSCLPLADFYATLPKYKEGPIDYWIRLSQGTHWMGRQPIAEPEIKHFIVNIFNIHFSTLIKRLHMGIYCSFILPQTFHSTE